MDGQGIPGPDGRGVCTWLPQLTPAVKGNRINRRMANKIAIDLKYHGYIEREHKSIERSAKIQQRKIPAQMNFSELDGISHEAREKLSRIRPTTIGQASRISGISPCDISVLTVHVEKHIRERVNK